MSMSTMSLTPKRSKRRPADMYTGAKFLTNSCGYLIVTDYLNSENVTVEFLTTGTSRKASTYHIREGKVNDPYHPSAHGIGYMGEGKYHGSVNNRETPAYSAWYSMLTRCYSRTFQQKYPTYIGCSVDPTWHNFQNFAEWYENNYPNDGKRYQLDKDILIKGNKIYSPSTCKFVTNQENSEKARARHWEVITPSGNHIKVYNLKKFCRENGLTHSAMVLVVHGKQKQHKGWTAPEKY